MYKIKISAFKKKGLAIAIGILRAGVVHEVSGFSMGWNPATCPGPFLCTWEPAGTDKRVTVLLLRCAGCCHQLSNFRVFFLFRAGNANVRLLGAFTERAQAKCPPLGNACLQLADFGPLGMLSLMLAAVRRLYAIKKGLQKLNSAYPSYHVSSSNEF